jgi:hypothetical protein
VNICDECRKTIHWYIDNYTDEILKDLKRVSLCEKVLSDSKAMSCIKSFTDVLTKCFRYDVGDLSMFLEKSYEKK